MEVRIVLSCIIGNANENYSVTEPLWALVVSSLVHFTDLGVKFQEVVRW